MGLFDAILKGIIQGLTEFLPISSSGHIAAYEHYFGDSMNGLFFTAILHLGTLLAVFLAFRKDIVELIKELGAMCKDLKGLKLFKTKLKDTNPQRRMIYMLVISCAVLIPVIPFKDKIEVLGGNMVALGCFFLYTAVILFLADKCVKGKKTNADLTPKDGLTVGIFQAIALFPGISRSGSTISSGLFSGMTRETAVKYSFILGIPTILAGCLFEFKDAFGGGESLGSIFPYVLGFMVALVTGIAAIKMVRWIVKSNRFTVFSIYTALLGLTVLSYELFIKK